jgi:hypothetical protein
MALRQWRLKLPSEDIERSEAFGAERVRRYKAGLDPASLAVASHGAENNPKLQAFARMAECAFCRCYGLDPHVILPWAGGADGGFDVRLGLRIDVKATSMSGGFLIWPVNKRHIFASKHFDVLVMVKGCVPWFLVWRWLTKAEFAARRQEAGPRHRLTEGTWFVEDKFCRRMEELEPYVNQAA